VFIPFNKTGEIDDSTKSNNGKTAQATLPVWCIGLLVIIVQGRRGVVMAYGGVC
tara:strand:- start:136 stop:297 length:162 start_codon:yes stop_codon:yes gene_type:complete